jgi:pyrroloquinoline quinone (PQQ) biosynthesis protein C
MGSLPGWMPVLIDRLNRGCSTSPWFIDLAEEKKVLSRGRMIILDLWPFIRELPLNIAAVCADVPENMTSALQLLNKLGDSERQYQKLFLAQFDLAGVRADEIDCHPLNPHTEKLRITMSTICRSANYVDGLYAIVAAELAASMLSRASLPSYERYFARHAAEYEPELINAGLEWLRLHAKTHTRHAIWMTRMLNELENEAGDKIPSACTLILDDLLVLWECSNESQQLTAGCLS